MSTISGGLVWSDTTHGRPSQSNDVVWETDRPDWIRWLLLMYCHNTTRSTTFDADDSLRVVDDAACRLWLVEMSWPWHRDTVTASLWLSASRPWLNDEQWLLWHTNVRGNQISRRRAESEAPKVPSIERESRRRVGWGMGRGTHRHPADYGVWRSVVSSPVWSGAEPRPKTILVLSGGRAPERLSLQFLSQILHFYCENVEVEPSPTWM